MRIKTSEKFYERKSQVSEPRSKHFIIFEGTKSEQIYFDAFLKKHEVITNVFFFLRDKEKEGWTNPQKIMELLISVINGNEKISFTYDTIFDNFYDYINQYVTTIIKKTMKNKYIWLSIFWNNCKSILNNDIHKCTNIHIPIFWKEKWW